MILCAADQLSNSSSRRFAGVVDWSNAEFGTFSSHNICQGRCWSVLHGGDHTSSPEVTCLRP